MGLFGLSDRYIEGRGRLLSLCGSVVVAVMLMGMSKMADNQDESVRVSSGISTIQEARDIVIAIDAGHGGYDPGKIGVDGQLEKDINLDICNILAEEIRKAGMTVVLTRDEDKALQGDGATSKKTSDLKERIRIMEDGGAMIGVSIHQNSFTQSSIRGAQVFYYEKSDEGKALSEYIQDSLKELDTSNKRVSKSNKSYYLLKNSSLPVVIVECGFLSNRDEAQKLCTQEYQRSLARKICDGIIKYLNGEVL